MDERRIPKGWLAAAAPLACDPKYKVDTLTTAAIQAMLPRLDGHHDASQYNCTRGITAPEMWSTDLTSTVSRHPFPS